MSDARTTLGNPEGTTGKLCTWINNTTYSSIPPSIIERAKYLILDGVACALVAAHLPWSETAAKGIFKMEPEGQCTVIGWEDKKIGPLPAALLNSTFIQGFELDDWHAKAPQHSNALILPALFAAIESQAQSDGKAFSGQDLLRAYTIGCEVGPRVGLALYGPDLLSRGWHSGAVQGPSSSAAAVSSLLGLEPYQIENALGIACTQAGGLMSAQFGSMAKRMQHGFPSRNGLFATLMAKEGYTGIQEVYEVPYGGFLSCFSQGVKQDPPFLQDEITSGLGQRWELEGVTVKLHSAMAALHSGIDATEQLQKQHPDKFSNEKLEDIEKITVKLSKPAFEHGGWTAPTDGPMSSMAAQMNVQYAVAAQLIDHEVLMTQYGAAKLNRPEIRELMSKIHPEHDPSLDSKEKQFATIVNLQFRDSSEPLQQYIEAAKGVKPAATNEEIVNKWRALVRGVIDDERRDKIEQKVLSLETVDDAKELVALLQGHATCPIDV